MRIVIDEETAEALERERAARGLRSRTEANKQIVAEADAARAWAIDAVGEDLAKRSKKGRKK